MLEINTRYQLWSCVQYNYSGLEENLEAKAAKGWELVSMGAFFLKFKKTEPTKKSFSVLFYSSAYSNPEKIGNTLEVNSCEQELQMLYGSEPAQLYADDDGWQKVLQWGSLHIYEAEEGKLPPVGVNEEARLKTASIAMRKRFLPAWTIAFGAMTILWMRDLITYAYKGESFLGSFIPFFYVSVMFGLALLGYKIWFNKSKTSISNGGKSVNLNWPLYAQNALLAIGIILLCIYIFSR